MPVGSLINSSAVMGRTAVAWGAAATSGHSVQLAVDDAQRTHLRVGVVGGAHQGRALHPAEAQLVEGEAPQLGELVQGVVAVNRQVAAGGLEVLADREDVDAPG